MCAHSECLYIVSVFLPQVIVVAIKNRNLAAPESSHELYEINAKETDFSEPKLAHTDQFR